MGYFGFQRKPSKTQQNPERPRLRIRLRIRLDDFVIITRGRARYIADEDDISIHALTESDKGNTLALSVYLWVIRAAKQVVNGTAQFIGHRCNGFKAWKASA